ncbi:hypothetical protein A374_08404 [Fictibacillus macauensis ZFHKF-1]|uniref:DUF3243 domain-containing protein n=1 Tax=Fictibacillus macauensis ZFHKF-1 TaxID=1196324 RepID=I8AJ75_9BACL|nr:DUF3243 domain-containing protein [Fictibacillus macauensis]EIT85842.1 hypothetical protein A374_08404 [Fictibacillus macauensis ZFHKF-1]
MGTEDRHILHKDEQVDLTNVDQAMDAMTDEQMKPILESFEHFKEYLHTRVSLGEKLGLSEETLAKAAKKVADHLAQTEQPRNAEEQLLQALWSVGNEQEKQGLAHMLIKLVQ